MRSQSDGDPSTIVYGLELAKTSPEPILLCSRHLWLDPQSTWSLTSCAKNCWSLFWSTFCMCLTDALNVNTLLMYFVPVILNHELNKKNYNMRKLILELAKANRVFQHCYTIIIISTLIHNLYFDEIKAYKIYPSNRWNLIIKFWVLHYTKTATFYISTFTTQRTFYGFNFSIFI